MKKRIALILAAVMVMSLTACANTSNGETKTEGTTAETSNDTEKPETITITSLNANKEKAELEVPFDPQRIAILDMACLDIIDNLGMGERVVGSASTSLDYLQSYVTDENITNLGTIKEADMEAVMECEPDIIFIGGRLSASYDALSEIAPVVYIATETEKGLVESVTDNAKIIASIFGLEDEVEAKTADFTARIEALQKAAEGKTALVGMTTSGSFNLLGNDGRCSIIGGEIGFENLAADTVSESHGSGSGRSGGSGEDSSSEGNSSEKGGSEESAAASEEKSSGSGQGGTSTHGNEASFETVVSLNPDYIFVMDRDSAIGTEGAQLAKEIMENELVMQTDAYKNGNIVYLEHPAVWYTAEGGITALGVMLEDLEGVLL